MGLKNASKLGGSPGLSVTDFTVASSGLFVWDPTQNTYQAKDDFSLTRGRHTFKVGAHMTDRRLYYLIQSVDKGRFAFLETYTKPCPVGKAVCDQARTDAGVPDGGLALADMIAGLYGAFATVTAVRARERGVAPGQVIDLSLLEPIISILGPEAAAYTITGEVKPRVGSGSNTTSPRNVYQTRDGKWIALSGSVQAMAERVFRLVGREDMLHDPRFKDNSSRVKHREEVDLPWVAGSPHKPARRLSRPSQRPR